jgi:putative FmdB family regulatory protein
MPLYEYYCESCDRFTDKTFKYSEKPTAVPCEHCESGVAEYRVGKPAMFRIQFDQNGRVAYQMDLGKGKKVYRSATREAYEHNLGNKGSKAAKEAGSDINKSVYTKEYGREVERKEKEKTEKFVKTLKEITKNAD